MVSLIRMLFDHGTVNDLEFVCLIEWKIELLKLEMKNLLCWVALYL